MSTKAGGKGPVVVTTEDLKRLIEEVAYADSPADTVLLCINAQVMYYPTKVGTMRGAGRGNEDWQGLTTNGGKLPCRHGHQNRQHRPHR
ncbi:MAG: hypothetical protein RL514_4245 [Verrucomicrobiota bacterium]|jgi:hypothetical protein